jgi:hypothetical protein
MALNSKTKRWVGGGVILLSILWLCFVGYIDWAMRQPPEVFGRVMAKMPIPAYFLFPFETMWTNARKGTLELGDTAPNFNVQMLEGNEPLALSALWANKPVVLVFGSYT